MTVEELVNRRIESYKPKGGLAQTARFFLALSKVHHPQVKAHLERVALTAEAVAKQLGKDSKAAFFAGLLHDVGKLILPPDLFNGREISADEYSRIKTHAVSGFKALEDLHDFTAYCAGLHHSLYQAGYGLSIQDFPKNWGPPTIKKVLEISTIVSICDFVDAHRYRATAIKDGGDAGAADLRCRLIAKFPDDPKIIDAVLAESRW